MALTGQQQRMASLIYGLGRSRGLNDARSRELVAASIAESGLNPSIRNKSSGAAGLFQLLSSGYVNTANRLGGVANPRANTLAILPSYLGYWRSHPNAAPGAAARDVERSGEGAGFYAGPLSQLAGFRPGAVTPGAPPPMPGPGQPSMPGGPAPPDLRPFRQEALQQLLSQTGASAQTADYSGFLGAIKSLRGAQAAQTEAPGMSPGAPSPAPAGGGPAGLPVRGGKVIGTPYHGTHTLGNWESDNAKDIAVPVGTPIYAVTNGTIGSQFGSLGSGGRFAGLRLHLVGKGNEWYYAHLSKFAPGIRPGARVRAGQIIGFSGSANGVAHLHIGARHGDPPS